MRALIAALTAIVVVAASACSKDDASVHPYGAQTATIGESLATLGWNMSVSNLRFDGDYVLFDVDASPAQADGPHANPKTSGSACTGRSRTRSRPTASEAVGTRPTLSCNHSRHPRPTVSPARCA
ncbi:uncharacterized protein RMCN_3659 [Mycolicibacterium novocastrense]|uniref:Uncharacterized protein n=1 Tax=Mycolicibacterium novocastrense TaxID=59813 RepID=A0ABQ0KLS1_MYCNV|nr:uncharacterized protein RMCN_3659 [Mycolicibacterium novocastrense]